jgi:hypothetical protein
MRLVTGAAASAVVMLALAAGVLAQEGAPADVAAKISGTWKLNVELSPAVTAPGRSGGRGRGGRASLAVGLAPLQRGGGGRGGGRSEGGSEASTELPAEEVIAQRVLQSFQQIPPDVTIAATVASVTFTEPTGHGTFMADGKTVEMNVEGAKIKVKTKWDKAALKQEFSTSRIKVIRAWSVDTANHLILAMKVESMMMISPETRAVFDRQP